MLNPVTLDWAYRSNEVQRPPVILVRGAGNGGGNNITSPPPTTPIDAPEIVIEVGDLRLPLAGDPRGGWKPHYLFAGHTSVHDYLTCHSSVLSPGQSPHPPHSHIEEEILIVLDGEGELLIGDGPDPGNARPHAVGPGTFAYYPAYQHHTLRNSGIGPLTYLMFKWRGTPLPSQSVVPVSVVEFGSEFGGSGSQHHRATRLIEGPTNFLSKLEIHCSEVQPGGGYKPHVDDYDVAIVMLSGEVETIGRKAGPCDVIYCAASEPHGLRGLGTEPARYLVIEFHGDRGQGAVREKLKGIIPEEARTFLRRLEVASRNYPAIRGMVPRWMKGLAKSLLK
jgi:mannose-6-phosphate isomerase-like protein (cupin superfamily)